MPDKNNLSNVLTIPQMTLYALHAAVVGLIVLLVLLPGKVASLATRPFTRSQKVACANCGHCHMPAESECPECRKPVVKGQAEAVTVTRQALFQSRFVRRMAMLAGGTLAGQLLIAASSPILTRMYGPEAFGVFGVFASILSIFMIPAALRYEFAIPIVQDREEAVDLVGVCFAAAAAVTGLAVLSVWLLGPWIASITDAPALAWLFWFLPVGVLFWGLSIPLNYWSVRQGTFKVNGTNKFIQNAGQAGSQLAFGFGGAGAWGLVAGFAMAPVAVLLHFLQALPSEERRELLAVRWRHVWSVAKQHWHYPTYSAPSALLQSSTMLLPAVLLAAMYGPAVAGWFALGQRIMGLPVKLLGRAADQVFLGEVKSLSDDAGVRRLFLRSTAGFAALGFAGMAPVLLFGPWLFALVFGAEWREAGLMAAILVPQYLARFVAVPVSQTLNIYGRQDLHLVSSLVNGAALVASFGAGYVAEFEAMTVLALYSAGMAFSYALYLVLAWLVVRKGGFRSSERPTRAVADELA